MKSTRCILSIILGLLAGWLPLGAVTVLKNLQVEYQTNPLGIDVSQPRFNWQMESDRYGACGQAYRLWVADSPEQLAAGRYIYDSGKVLSGESVGVVYQGKALQPSTRYYWKVSVWDESGTEITSTEPAWFETGLLGSGWSGARWIGSSETQLSKYRSHYVIDYDVRVAEGNDKAAFVFGARDADNYVSAELDLNGSGDARFILRHTTDGKTTQDASESLASIIPASDKHKAHHIRLKVTTAQYALKYFVDIEIDGKTFHKPPEFLTRQKTGFRSIPRPLEPAVSVKPFLEQHKTILIKMECLKFPAIPSAEKINCICIRIEFICIAYDSHKPVETFSHICTSGDNEDLRHTGQIT